MNEEVVNQYLAAAQEDVEVAHQLFRNLHIRTAASRSYYAMFYAATALLAHRSLAFSKHSGVIDGYGKEFSRTGALDPKYHKWLIRAFRIRNTADYALDTILTEDDVTELLAQAREFVQAARDYLTRERST